MNKGSYFYSPLRDRYYIPLIIASRYPVRGSYPIPKQVKRKRQPTRSLFGIRLRLAHIPIILKIGYELNSIRSQEPGSGSSERAVDYA